MSKRKSPAETLFIEIAEIATFIPWWISVLVAGLLFLLVPSPFELSEVAFETNQMAAYFAKMFGFGFFKYFVPAALLAGVLTLIIRYGKGAFMFRSIRMNGVKNAVAKLSWHEFEILISEYFRKQGYKVEIVGGNGADGGVDVRLYKDGELHLVQCKHYKKSTVSVHVVRELFGVMNAEGASKAYVITSGRFTKEARTFATQSGVELIDGNKLEVILNSEQLEASERVTQKQVCQYCGNQLVLRSGKRGKFWGCSSFPKCKFTKDY